MVVPTADRFINNYTRHMLVAGNHSANFCDKERSRYLLVIYYQDMAQVSSGGAQNSLHTVVISLHHMQALKH